MIAAAAASSLALRFRQSDSRAANRDSASWLDNRSSCNTTGIVICASMPRANASTNFV